MGARCLERDRLILCVETWWRQPSLLSLQAHRVLFSWGAHLLSYVFRVWNNLWWPTAGVGGRDLENGHQSLGPSYNNSSCPLSVKSWGWGKWPSSGQLASSKGQRFFSLDPLCLWQGSNTHTSYLISHNQSPVDPSPLLFKTWPVLMMIFQGGTLWGNPCSGSFWKTPKGRNKACHKPGKSRHGHPWLLSQKSQEKVAGFFFCFRCLYNCWSRVSHGVLTMEVFRRNWLDYLFYLWETSFESCQ